jgi:hypothetical protein
MLLAPDNTAEHDDAQMKTLALLFEMEERADGNAETAMVLGNSMIAAARLLFRRMGIDGKQQIELYREFWKPMVEKGVEA